MNRCVCDEIVPADAHYAAEGFCVEGIEAFVKLSVVVTGCVPMSVDGGVGIHGLKD